MKLPPGAVDQPHALQHQDARPVENELFLDFRHAGHGYIPFAAARMGSRNSSGVGRLPGKTP